MSKKIDVSHVHQSSQGNSSMIINQGVSPELFLNYSGVGIGMFFAYNVLKKSLEKIEDRKSETRAIQQLSRDNEEITDGSSGNIEKLTKYSKTEEQQKNLCTKIKHTINIENVSDFSELAKKYNRPILNAFYDSFIEQKYLEMIDKNKLSQSQMKEYVRVISDKEPIDQVFPKLKRWMIADPVNRREAFCYYLSVINTDHLSDEILPNILNETDGCKICRKVVKNVSKAFQIKLSEFNVKYSDYSNLTGGLKKLRQEYADSRQKYEDQISELQKDLDQRSTKCDEHVTENSDLKDVLEKLRKEYADSSQKFEDQISELQKDLDHRNTKCNEHVTENSNLKDVLGQLSKENTNYKTEIEKLIKKNHFSNCLLLVICTLKNAKNNADILLYSKKLNECLTIVKQQNLEKMFYPTGAVLENSLVLIGGNIDKDVSTKTIRIDLETRERIPMADMIQKRSGCACVVLNDVLYVIGGIDDNERSLDSVEMYNCYSNTWTMKRNMIKKRWNHAAVAFNERIYVFGCLDENDYYVKSVEVYDPDSNQWDIISDQSGNKIIGSISFDFKASLATVHKNSIYVYEKHDDSKNAHCVNIFCPATESWSRLPPLPNPQQCCSLVSFEDGLIFFGDKNNYINRCSTVDSEWKQLKNIQKINFMSLALFSPTINI